MFYKCRSYLGFWNKKIKCGFKIKHEAKNKEINTNDEQKVCL